MPNLIPAEVASFYTYDPESGEFYRVKTRAGNPMTPRPIRAISGTGVGHYAIVFFGRQYKVHRIAWFFMTGEQPPECIDHINGDPLDNRWCNLRAATVAQNHWNAGPRRKGLKGVNFDKRRNTFGATIRANGVRIWLGSYATEEEAHAAYCAGAAKHHGEFARTE